MTWDLYDILGVKKNATDKEIKDAYREQAKKNHPDKGGDEDRFKDVTRAYGILRSADTRDRYDAQGDDGKPLNELNELIGLINTCMGQFLGGMDVRRQSFTDFCKKVVKEGTRQAERTITDKLKELAKLREVRSRMPQQEGNPFLLTIDDAIAGAERTIKVNEMMIERNEKMIAVLDGYEYRVDEQEFDPNSPEGIESAMRFLQARYS